MAFDRGDASSGTGTVAVIPIEAGGTNATTAAQARTNLGLGTISTQNSSNVSIIGGAITGITDLAVADGGTGSSTASGARTNLGAAASGSNTDITSLTALGAGSASTPSITPTGDTNTGMFFPAADTIAFAEGGTESVRLTSTGSVGIGTNAPETTLDINGQFRGKFTDVGTNTAAQDLATNSVSQVTISASTTLTTTVPPAGTRAMVIIITSGTNSRTVTFGTGFASTGTLSTGINSGRRFVIGFISDGTRLLETGRTTAITV